MSRRPGRTVAQWRDVVFASTEISDAVRVYLLKLSEHMSADRMVSVPRSQLASELGRHEQRIAERNAAAIKAGLLGAVSPGYKGHVAVYQGLFPEPKGTEKPYAFCVPPGQYAITPDCVPPGGYTSS